MNGGRGAARWESNGQHTQGGEGGKGGQGVSGAPSVRRVLGAGSSHKLESLGLNTWEPRSVRLPDPPVKLGKEERTRVDRTTKFLMCKNTDSTPAIARKEMEDPDASRRTAMPPRRNIARTGVLRSAAGRLVAGGCGGRRGEFRIFYLTDKGLQGTPGGGGKRGRVRGRGVRVCVWYGVGCARRSGTAV